MRRPKLKKASKRVSCAKRYKIQKKVREHNRKLKKEAKKKGVQKRVKKDPGVPNSAPFKEEVLREAEQRRLQLEEENERKRQAKKEERAQKRKQDKEAATKETEPKAKKTRRLVVTSAQKQSVKSNTGYKSSLPALTLSVAKILTSDTTTAKDKTGDKPTAPNKNSKQFLCAQLNKVIDASDVVIEVLDARDPLGSRCPQLEEAVLLGGGNKKLLLVLNKIDLVPKETVETWMECLQKELPVVAFKASARIQDKTEGAKKRRIVPSNEVLDKSRGAASLGGVRLSELLTSYAAKTQNEAALKVGVVGFPNVGKSSFINSLKGMLVCHLGASRGTTKTMQEVHLSKQVKLIDSPGVVASPSNPQVSLTLRSLQVEEGHLSVLDAARTLLKQCDQSQIMLQYNVPDFRNSLEFLILFAKKRGYLQKGGVPNTEQAALTFLSDWTGAKLSYYCRVPPNYSPPPYMSDAVVTEMRSGWDLNKVKLGNVETLKGFKFPNQASCIHFTSKGPTAGLLSASEETPAAAPEEEMQENENIEPQQTENSCEVELKKPQKPSHKENSNKVKFQSFPIDISFSTVTTDDAYDFNTDFK